MSNWGFETGSSKRTVSVGGPITVCHVIVGVKPRQIHTLKLKVALYTSKLIRRLKFSIGGPTPVARKA